MVLTGCGASNAAGSTAPASANGAEGVPLAEYTMTLTVDLLPAICGDPSAPLRACFTVDEAVCIAAFSQALQACSHAENLELPAVVTDANEEVVSQRLGGCAGMVYIRALSDAGMVRQTPECQQ